MKPVPADLAAALASGVTTLATCWRLTRADGTVLGFTDHDRPLTFDGVTHEAATGFTASEAVARADLSVGGLEVVAALPLALEDLGNALTFRVGPIREDYTRPSNVEITVTPTARGLWPWSPAHLAAEVDPSTGDIRFSWVRRSRGPGADGWGAGEVPLPEGSEAYRLELRHGATLLRSVDVATPSWTWSRALRDADLGPSAADVTTRVAQIAATVGPGVWREAVFHL